MYGAGMLGKHLLKELENTQVRVEYVIDQRAKGIDVGVRAYLPDEHCPETEAVVVTATYDYQNTRRELLERDCKNIVSLEEIVLELQGQV